jgi:hypothetical protein
MVPVVEPMEQMNTFTADTISPSARTSGLWGDSLSVGGIAFFELLKDADFDLAGIAILWDGADNLDGYA